MICEDEQVNQKVLKATPLYADDKARIGSIRRYSVLIGDQHEPAASRSFTTSPAMIRPTTDGTKAVEPGMSRRTVHLRAPGGQMQWLRQLMDGSSRGRMLSPSPDVLSGQTPQG